MYLKGRPITMYMPKDQVDSYSLEARADLPSNKLKLDWVYPFTAACFKKASRDATCVIPTEVFLLVSFFCSGNFTEEIKIPTCYMEGSEK